MGWGTMMGQRCGARMAVRFLALLAVGALAAMTVLVGGVRSADARDTSGQLMIVMDSSGSMAGPDGDGGTKIGAAKKAITRMVDTAPAGSKIGLRVYGADKGKNDPAACKDSRRVVDVGPVDRQRITAAARRMTPRGQTPISYSLQKAAGDFTGSEPRTILLVSDGIETCDPDPCKTVAKLRDAGVRLRIDVVGFRVDRKARNQLQCIARSGHGTYYDADDGPSLENTFTRNSVRALRQYRFAGRPVNGSTDPRTGPVIRPGQYVDTLPGSTSKDRVTKFYTVDRRPGETVHFSATVLPPASDHDGRTSAMLVGTATADLEDCTNGSGDRLDDTGDTGPLTATASIDPDNVRDSCNQGGKFRVGVRWAYTDGEGTQKRSPSVPVEITLLIEPKVTNAESLPDEEGLESDAVRPKPHGATSIAGGGSFTDAPTIESGTYKDTIRPGETLFYRVPLDWGQLLAYRADFPTLSGPDARVVASATPDVEVQAASPLRTKAAATSVRHSTTFYDGSDTYDGSATSLWFATPEVRYNNRAIGASKERSSASLAGYYYIQVHLSPVRGTKLAVPFRLTADVQGDPSGKPEYQQSSAGDPVSQQDRGTTPGPESAASPSSTPAPSATRPIASSLGWLALGAGVVLIVAGGVTVLVFLRRRT